MNDIDAYEQECMDNSMEILLANLTLEGVSCGSVDGWLLEVCRE